MAGINDARVDGLLATTFPPEFTATRSPKAPAVISMKKNAIAKKIRK